MYPFRDWQCSVCGSTWEGCKVDSTCTACGACNEPEPHDPAGCGAIHHPENLAESQRLVDKLHRDYPDAKLYLDEASRAAEQKARGDSFAWPLSLTVLASAGVGWGLASVREPRRPPERPCLQCGKPKRHSNSFCSAECCKAYRGRDSTGG